MTARRFLQVTPVLSLSAVALFCLLPAAALRAQDSINPEVENSKYQFTGIVNSNAVYVRSGPSENDYPTVKLDKGAQVTVVGIRFDWLKVVPPEGSFCYVAKAYVDRRGDGRVGRVTSTLNVRVGSQLNEIKAKIAQKLEPGADVEIVGEEQEYFKIKPPSDTYFYVNKQYVDPVAPVNLAQNDPENPVSPQEPEDATGEAPLPPVGTDDALVRDTGEITTDRLPGIDEPETTVTPTTGPAVADGQATDVTTPAATQPVADAAEAEAEFDRLEALYAEASLRPLDQQPLNEMLDGYEKLAAGTALPESLRRIAEFKSEVLKGRLDAQTQFSETRRAIDDMNQKQMALRAEKDEIEQRLKDAEIHFYTAVGTLRPSSVQVGSETLYRLTDPASGRTVVYVRSNDTKLAALLGQFIGVKGEVQNESAMNLRVVTPTEFEEVNPSKVGLSVAAQIVPPSLLPTARTE